MFRTNRKDKAGYAGAGLFLEWAFDSQEGVE
jgi:hypothetical protein